MSKNLRLRKLMLRVVLSYNLEIYGSGLGPRLECFNRHLSGLLPELQSLLTLEALKDCDLQKELLMFSNSLERCSVPELTKRSPYLQGLFPISVTKTGSSQWRANRVLMAPMLKLPANFKEELLVEAMELLIEIADANGAKLDAIPLIVKAHRVRLSYYGSYHPLEGWTIRSSTDVSSEHYLTMLEHERSLMHLFDKHFSSM